MDSLLLTEEEQLLRTTVRTFADDALAPRASAYDQSGDFPADNVEGLAELGLFGLGIDEAYGGSGGTARQGAIVAEELARGCTATSTVYVAHQSLAAQFIQYVWNCGAQEPVPSGYDGGADDWGVRAHGAWRRQRRGRHPHDRREGRRRLRPERVEGVHNERDGGRTARRAGVTRPQPRLEAVSWP